MSLNLYKSVVRTDFGYEIYESGDAEDRFHLILCK